MKTSPKIFAAILLTLTFSLPTFAGVIECPRPEGQIDIPPTPPAGQIDIPPAPPAGQMDTPVINPTGFASTVEASPLDSRVHGSFVNFLLGLLQLF
jgi:hypothetical protein